MDKSDLATVKSTLNQHKEIDVYKLYNDADIDKLIAEIEQILKDEEEVRTISSNQYYARNIYDLVLFIYNKVLSQTKTNNVATKQPAKHKLLSKDSLNTLYSFAG